MNSRIVMILVMFVSVFTLVSCIKLEKSYKSVTSQYEGMEQFTEGNANKAVKDYKKAIELDADGVLYFRIGLAYKKLGEKELAVKSFEKAKELSPFLAREADKELEELK